MRIALLAVMIALLISSNPVWAQQKDLAPWVNGPAKTGLFASGEVSYTITNGTIYATSFAAIHFYSNTTISLGTGQYIADFKLVKLGAEPVELDSFSQSIYGITASGYYWSTLLSNSSTSYSFGVVISEKNTGEILGELISTIKTVPPIQLVVDKAEYTYRDTLIFKIVNKSLSLVTAGEPYRIQLKTDSGWKNVDSGISAWILILHVVRAGQNLTQKVDLSIAKIQLTGDYRIVKNYTYPFSEIERSLTAEFRITEAPPATLSAANSWVYFAIPMVGILIIGIIYLKRRSSKTISNIH
jgi:hypothetical protein